MERVEVLGVLLLGRCWTARVRVGCLRPNPTDVKDLGCHHGSDSFGPTTTTVDSWDFSLHLPPKMGVLPSLSWDPPPLWVLCSLFGGGGTLSPTNSGRWWLGVSRPRSSVQGACDTRVSYNPSPTPTRGPDLCSQFSTSITPLGLSCRRVGDKDSSSFMSTLVGWTGTNTDYYYCPTHPRRYGPARSTTRSDRLIRVLHSKDSGTKTSTPPTTVNGV